LPSSSRARGSAHRFEGEAADPGRRRTRPAGRPLRSHQHPPATAHPPRLRAEPRVAHRHGRPHPRRPLPTTPRTIMKITHGNVS